MEHRGRRFDLVRGTDADGKGLALECWEAGADGGVRVLSAFRADDGGSFTFTAFVPDLPFEVVEWFVEEARAQLPATPASRPAEPTLLAKPPPRGQLGIRFEPLGLGVLVREVAPDGPAAGLVEPGDVLLSANGRPLDALEPEAVAALLVGAPGEARRVEVYRGGRSAEVVLVAR